MEYNFRNIEKKWQQKWIDQRIYQVSDNSKKPKYYVLDMFPYPSGAGLHVGHPLGYIASDIVARFKRLKGFNVLHPMGYDAFGLPAEQYALDNGVHPAISTAKNIATFRSQLDKIGFSFDWSRQVNTSEPFYYKWTQWIFLQLFNSWYNHTTNKTESIDTLTQIFEREGNLNHPPQDGQFQVEGSSLTQFDAKKWIHFDQKTKEDILMQYRIAYCGMGEVNWCEVLGTVLANDEVINGLSERGGHPVVKKKLRQWYLRITEYAERLLEGLNKVDFSEPMKEMQTNWIGRSTGAEITFTLSDLPFSLEVYTTRPDTIFGVDFMVIAPEHELVPKITTLAQHHAVDQYLTQVQRRSERERISEKKISGVFTGAFALHPFTEKKIPIWISEYVLAGYGTGAIMGVPCGDERDHKFAQHYKLPITNIIGTAYNGVEANPTKEALLTNSYFLDGLKMRDALDIASDEIEKRGIGKRKINYKMRDAAFSRQRYWGEPFPIQWINGVAHPLNEIQLPLLLPHVQNYSAGQQGEGPLAKIEAWTSQNLETNTMPGYAGSSWYFLRYMDPFNEKAFCARQISDYWNQVDLYVGGTEHAVGHLLYSRMWTKVLFDLGFIGFDEPFKKLLNQGMIQGSSRFVYRIRGSNKFVSSGLKNEFTTDSLHVDVNLVDGIILDTTAFKRWKQEFADAEYILENGHYLCGAEVEKMSKSKVNTVNPDAIVDQYGADTFRMYEMFLGPVEMSKPWDTKGIEGVHRFLKKLWRLFFDDQKGLIVLDQKASPEEQKILHKTIKKIGDDTERFSFNTVVSAFMVCTNELTDLKCHKKEILEPLLILLAPYAPHIAEELYYQIQLAKGQPQEILSSVLNAKFPATEEKYLIENSKEYPISVNGKLRTTILIDLGALQPQVEEIVLNNNVVKKWLEGKQPKKIIFVKGKMVNIVV
ncbi:MAG: leucine--tRNA ligase [Flavisolibacter sp.]